MNLTRRGFLAGVGLAAAAAAGLAWTGRDRLRRWLLVASTGGDRPGPLRDSTAAVLAATVRTLLEDRVVVSHYLETFRWRAGHLRGARALYERFELAVDRAARDAGHEGFRGATEDARRKILDALRPARGWRRVRRLVAARDEERFARHVVREIFRRFARTDAWVLAGYESWPGMPRALTRLSPGPPP